jgi:hypothetical protein
MKRIICGLCVALGALTLAATASAKAPHHPSELFFVGSEGIDDSLYVAGGVSSPSERCVAKRTVKVLFDYGDGFDLVDVAKSSNNGGFAGIGPDEDNGNPVERLKFSTPEKTYRKNGRKHVCDGDKLVIS